MKRKSAEDTLTLDDLMCHKHRLPIRGICLGENCQGDCRYLCSTCTSTIHKFEKTEYIDEILNWDYISTHKFQRIIDILEERKSRREHKLKDLEKNIGTSFDNLKISIDTLIEHKRSELLIALKEEATFSSCKEVILLSKIKNLRKEHKKQLKEFNLKNFLQEDLGPYIEKYNEIKIFETKFHKAQKQPVMTIPFLFETCSKIQQELACEIPKCIEQFEKQQSFKRLEKIVSSFPKFTLNKEHVKISFLQCLTTSTSQEQFKIELEDDEDQETDCNDEPTFQRLGVLQYDDTNDFLYTQSTTKSFIVLNGLKSKSLHFSYPIQNEISCSVLSEETQVFYFGTENGEVFGFDNVSKNIQKIYEFGTKISAIAIVPSQPTWIIVAVQNCLLFLDSTKDPLLFKTYELTRWISAISYNSAHNLFIIGFENGKVSLWSLDSNSEISSNRPSLTKCGKQIIQSPDRNSFFTIDENNTICLWRISQRSLKLMKKIKSGPILPLDFLPLYSHNLLILKENWVLKIYTLNTLKLVRKLSLDIAEDYKMLYDASNAILNIYKIDRKEDDA